MDAIVTQGLRKEVRSGSERIAVLKGIDLAVPAGQIAAVMGPSGSGKSTLLSLLGGLDRPTAGRVVVGGEVISERSEAELARWRRRHLGFVFQSFHLFRALTVLENVAVPLRLAGRKDAWARARSLLEAMGLGGRLHHYPPQLSGGEQQRVAIARAFAAEPRILLADEPTGNLDRATGEEVMDLMMRQARATGATLVIVTHDPAVAGRCDRVFLLEDGRIRLRGGTAHAR